MRNKVIFWDFQGTLAKNDWMFSKALYKVLIQHEPHTSIKVEDFKSKPMNGFPWQSHERDYLHLRDSRAWWSYAEQIFIDFYKEFGFAEEKAVFWAQKVKAELIKSDEFCLYEDTIEMLSYFKQRGFDNIILSNHIPELENIVEGLGLSQYISLCITSAGVGYEKPHPEIYRYALSKVPEAEEIWMIGDNPIADVKGAEGAGIKGVLVRSRNEGSVQYYSKDLRGLKEVIIEGS